MVSFRVGEVAAMAKYAMGTMQEVIQYQLQQVHLEPTEQLLLLRAVLLTHVLFWTIDLSLVGDRIVTER